METKSRYDLLYDEFAKSVPPQSIIRRSGAINDCFCLCLGVAVTATQSRSTRHDWEKYWTISSPKTPHEILAELDKPLGDYWDYDETRHITTCLNGMFSDAGKVAENNLELFDFSHGELKRCVGDKMSDCVIHKVLGSKPYGRDDYKAIVIHPAVLGKLLENDKISFIKMPDGTQIPMLCGLYVITNCGCEVFQNGDDRVISYKSYLLAKNAIRITEVDSDEPVSIKEDVKVTFKRSYEICPSGMSGMPPFLDGAVGLKKPDTWVTEETELLGAVGLFTNG